MNELEEIRQKVNEIHENVVTLKTTLLGNPGTANGGLLSEVKALKSDYYRFKTKVLIIASVALGSGFAGGAIITKLLERLF